MRTSRQNRKGTMIELLVVALLLAVLVVLLAVPWSRAHKEAMGFRVSTSQSVLSAHGPSIDEKPIWENPVLLLALGTTIAGIAYSYRRLHAFADLRVELCVLEVISDHKAHDQDAITQAVKRRSTLSRIFAGSVRDALASLVSKNQVKIKNGKYMMR